MQQLERAGAQSVYVDFPSAEEIISPNGWDWEYAAGESGSSHSEFEVVKIEFYRSLSNYPKALRNNKDRILFQQKRIAYDVKHINKERGVPDTHSA